MTPAPRRGRAPRRKGTSPGLRRRLVAAALVVGVAVVVVAGFRLVRVADQLRTARGLIESAGTNVESGHLGDARAQLLRAEQLLLGANGDLYDSVAVGAIGWVPVVHQNVQALRDSVGVALRLVSGAEGLLEAAKPLEGPNGKAEVTLDQGRIPLDAVQAVQRAGALLAQGLPDAGGSPPSSLVVGPIRDLHDKVYAEAGRRRQELDGLGRGLALLEEMSGANGPRRYLIAVANSAEMRGGGGMVLSYGVLDGDGGKISLGAFGKIDDLYLDAPVEAAAAALPPDYAARWSGLEPARLWRNTTLGPDLRVSAKTMLALYQASTGQSADGVIYIDPAGLGSVLRGTGPVDVDGVGTVTADNVVDLTLNRAYVDVPDRDQRQELLGDVARAVFDRFVNGRFASLRPFADAIVDTVAGRHIQLYTTSTEGEATAASFGADGSLPDPGAQDYLALTVQNLSKNKLDYYLETGLTVTGTRAPAVPGRLHVTIDVANPVPPDLRASYVTGPNDPALVAGEYRGIVSLYVPAGTTLAAPAAADGAPQLVAESGRGVVTFPIDLRAGERRSVTFDLELAARPAAGYQLTLVPQPRVRPTVVAVDVAAGAGRLQRAPGPLTAIEELDPLQGPVPSASK